MSCKLPSIIITGASGFVGCHLLDDLKDEYRIFAIARRSQRECSAPIHANIAWIRADIADYQSITQAFREIATAGGADFLIHLAAYYDFSGENRPEYQQTNVMGTEHILQLAKELDLRLLVFASSVAACSFPNEGEEVNEESRPDGSSVYARSKRLGEEMVLKYSRDHPACIVRMGAIFSDWCEYPPLYVFLRTWLGKSRTARILAGRGESAIPYIHIRDIVTFFRRVLDRHAQLKSTPVLVASTGGSTSHRELYDLATRYYYGKTRSPILVPAFLCGIGLRFMKLWGRLSGHMPFERPWMRHYIDLKLNVNNRLSCSILEWFPGARHRIEKRLHFLLERLKSEPLSWQFRNLAALKRDTTRPGLRIHNAVADWEDEITGSLVEQVVDVAGAGQYPHMSKIDRTEFTWFVRLLYRLVLTSIDTGNRMLVLNYFEISGFSRFEAGSTANEIIHLLTLLNKMIVDRLTQSEDLRAFDQEIYDCITMPIEFGKDEVEQQYELFLQHVGGKIKRVKTVAADTSRTAREQLEETIWTCLRHRR